MFDLAVFAASWLMLFFSVFVIFQTVGVNLVPAWANSRVFLILAVLMTVIGSNSMVG